MAERYHARASAAEEMRANMLSVSTAMELSSGGIGSVAHSIGDNEGKKELAHARLADFENARKELFRCLDELYLS